MSTQATLDGDSIDETPEEDLCGVCMNEEWVVELTFVRSGDTEFDISGKFCGDCGSRAQELILDAQQGGVDFDG